MRRIVTVAAAMMLAAGACRGYTVLTHEAILDSVWEDSLKKLLRKRFPGATAEELDKAHAYAYGGCIVQDMGYYPFSSRLFSDLTHYVRTGDFIQALLRESQNLNEYAFALGALEHYAADVEGHRLATNRAVPLLYPSLRRKFGHAVTYWDDPAAHVRTEFGFDVVQVARGRYAPDGYRRFIGFEVSRDVLERAFQATYGFEMKDIMGSVALALGSYRHTVSGIIPGMTRVAWNLRKEELVREIPGITRKRFLYNLSKASYEKEWGKEYYRPGLGTRILTFLFRIIPRSGPFTGLEVKTPTPEVEKLFMASFNATIDRYRALVGQVGEGTLTLANENFDLGARSVAGEYKGADETYGTLVDRFASRQFTGMPVELRRDVLAYYKNRKAGSPSRAATRKERAAAVAFEDRLGRLRQFGDGSATGPAVGAPRP